MEKQCFDHNWRFCLDDSYRLRWPDAADPAWRTVNLPHDWSIEGERRPDNPSGPDGGFFPMGRGLYSKTFAAPPEWRGQKVMVEFEGVYMNAEVSLNEHFLGRHPYGYTSFVLDLSPYLKPGAENTLRVRVDNSTLMNSRWYSGSGIYRHVWLLTAGPVHVAHWGVYVTTPVVSAEAATVRVRTTLENDTASAQPVTLRSRVLAPDGSIAAVTETAETLAAHGRREFARELTVAAPQLWSPDTPNLYRLETEVLVAGQVVDTEVTPFGIRSLHVDAELGFLLNGRPLALRGGCVHHDNGVLGAASFDRAEERKVELHKASGYNAIRCAHNPPAPAFLEACDRLGMLVIDEAFDCWREGKNPGDYHVAFDDWWQRDIESMVRRDRNHPSIIMWSIGNEVNERDGRSGGAQVARMLADHVRSLDPTRPITSAICGLWGPGEWAQTDPVFAALDVGGYNYQEKQYRPDHERHPERVMVGLESVPMEAFEHWMDVQDLPYVIGDFVWTSLDYLGEAGIGRLRPVGEKEHLPGYPWHQANCGDMDLCGFKRPQSYYRDVLWQRGDPLYIAVHTPLPAEPKLEPSYWGWPEVWPNWTWPGREGETFKVDVYSACEQVELFLNGRSLGAQPTTRRERFMATFDVPYEPGALRAVGYQGSKPCAECTLQTCSAPARIRLSPDRAAIKAAPGSLSYVTVEILDAEGRVHPTAEPQVFFTIQGPGAIAAVGNSNPRSEEPYRGHTRRAFRGRCLAVVQAGEQSGEIHLRAQADGIEPAEVVIRAE